ncbi:MAG TPA: cytochrome c [Rhizomicrobium sp.]|nr:cytochrome c [Rhizomicrobium sp.]
MAVEIRIVALFALLVAAMLGGRTQAADAVGPFTQAQVSAGRNAFLTYCSGCHNSYLLGNSGPPLAGPFFLDDWAAKSTHQLFRFASTNMPLNAPGTLPQETYLNLIAFILAVNGARPGQTPFSKDSDVTIGGIVSGNLVVPVLEGEPDPVRTLPLRTKSGPGGGH